MHERTSSLIGDDGAIFDFAVLLEQASQPVSSHIECKSSHEQLAVVHIIFSTWCCKLSIGTVLVARVVNVDSATLQLVRTSANNNETNVHEVKIVKRQCFVSRDVRTSTSVCPRSTADAAPALVLNVTKPKPLDRPGHS